MTKRILIVDDSLAVREQIASILTRAGYEVSEAADGVEGLVQVRTGPELALILCDLNMPKMDGLAMLAELKASGVNHCPVVMLTSEGASDAIARAKTLGAKAWIVKPAPPDLLVAAVRKLTERPSATTR